MLDHAGDHGAWIRWPRVEEMEAVDHPAHYGGADDPYEAIKVIEHWDLGFHLGNTVKCIARSGKKGDKLEDLKKARWYLDREISNAEEAIERVQSLTEIVDGLRGQREGPPTRLERS